MSKSGIVNSPQSTVNRRQEKAAEGRRRRGRESQSAESRGQKAKGRRLKDEGSVLCSALCLLLSSLILDPLSFILPPSPAFSCLHLPSTIEQKDLLMILKIGFMLERVRQLRWHPERSSGANITQRCSPCVCGALRSSHHPSQRGFASPAPLAHTLYHRGGFPCPTTCTPFPLPAWRFTIHSPRPSVRL
jgi:hypothetical protein